MDPDAVLAHLRDSITRHRDAAAAVLYPDSEQAARADEAANDVIDAAVALDRWLTRGGFPPTAWVRPGALGYTVVGVWDGDQPVPVGVIRGRHDVAGGDPGLGEGQGPWATWVDAAGTAQAEAFAVAEMQEEDEDDAEDTAD